MKRLVISSIAAAAIAAAVSARAHDAPNLEHTHAFQQTGYGTWRQGHYVNGPQGSIIIWSPQDYTGYENAPAVRFARPQPISRPPVSRLIKPGAGRQPAPDYGKKQQRD